MTGLTPADLQAHTRSELESVLAYLSLPPVGAMADTRVPTVGDDSQFELSRSIRDAVRQRRTAAGGLTRPETLLDLPALGPAELSAIVARLSDLTRYGHRLEPVWGGPAGKKALFDLIDSAEQSVHIQMYVFGGDVGMELVRQLAEKAEAGVEVRLLFTASGFIISGGPSGTGLVSSLSELRSYLVADMYRRKRMVEAIRRSKIQMVDSGPIGRHYRRSSLKAQGVTDERSYRAWATARGIPDGWLAEQLAIDEHCAFGFTNVDHRKMVLVDGKRAMIGSQNLADSYYYDNELSPDPRVNRARWQWHDNSSLLQGGVVGALNEVFAQRWMLSGGGPFDWKAPRYAPPPERVGDAVVATQATVPGLLRMEMSRNWSRLMMSMLGADRRPIIEGDNPIRTRMLQLPTLATQELLVEHCYPSDSDLLGKWAAAAGHLDRFTMVVPRHYDTMLLGLECDRFFPELMAAGVRLEGYDRAIMHSKIAVADGWYTSTGSYNLTVRSARADLELQFFVQCPTYGAAVRDRILGDIADCAPITPTALDRFRARRSLPVIDALVRYFFF